MAKPFEQRDKFAIHRIVFQREAYSFSCTVWTAVTPAGTLTLTKTLRGDAWSLRYVAPGVTVNALRTSPRACVIALQKKMNLHACFTEHNRKWWERKRT